MEDFLNIDLSEALVSEELPTIGENERYYLHELVDRTTLDEVQKSDVNAQIDECLTLGEYEEIEHYLQLNLIQDKDRICMGLNYNQTDIKKALRKAMLHDEPSVLIAQRIAEDKLTMVTG